MTSVTSTAIRSIGFKDNELYVLFNTNVLYVYAAVPPKVYKKFQAAKSKGGFFAKLIRGKYEFEKVV